MAEKWADLDGAQKAELVMALYARGRTLTQIARELGAPSRGAIGGVIYRARRAECHRPRMAEAADRRRSAKLDAERLVRARPPKVMPVKVGVRTEPGRAGHGQANYVRTGHVDVKPLPTVMAREEVLALSPLMLWNAEERRRIHCGWPCWPNGERANLAVAMICGRQTFKPGASYCKDHAALARAPRAPRVSLNPETDGRRFNGKRKRHSIRSARLSALEEA